MILSGKEDRSSSTTGIIITSPISGRVEREPSSCKDMSEFRNLSILYVNKALNAAAMDFYYKVNTFRFTSPGCVVEFSQQTWDKGPLLLDDVTKLHLELDVFWGDFEGSEDESGTIIQPGWKHVFDNDIWGLRWLFPKLRYLEIDFYEWHNSAKNGHSACTIYADTCVNSNFPEIRAVLEEMVRVEVVEVSGLGNKDTERELEKAMMAGPPTTEDAEASQITEYLNNGPAENGGEAIGDAGTSVGLEEPESGGEEVADP